jgi:DNA mismatch repair protein MutS
VPRRWAPRAARWLKRPLRDRAVLNALRGARRSAHDQCPAALSDPATVGDVERILARIALRSARPRDLAQLRDAARCCRHCKARWRLDRRCCRRWPAARRPCRRCMRCSSARSRNPPMLLRDGGVIAAGYDASLDELRDISEHADRYLLDLEARERERTGIPNLKVGYNRVHGYYIEVSRAARPARCPRITSAARRSRTPSATSRRS